MTKAEYQELHKYCPTCGHDKIFEDSPHKSSFDPTKEREDHTHFSCLSCGYESYKHTLVSEGALEELGLSSLATILLFNNKYSMYPIFTVKIGMSGSKVDKGTFKEAYEDYEDCLDSGFNRYSGYIEYPYIYANTSDSDVRAVCEKALKILGYGCFNAFKESHIYKEKQLHKFLYEGIEAGFQL